MAGIAVLVLDRDRNFLQRCADELQSVQSTTYELTFEQDEASLFSTMDSGRFDCMLFGEVGTRESDRALAKWIHELHPHLPVVMARQVPALSGDETQAGGERHVSPMHAAILDAIAAAKHGSEPKPDADLPVILLVDDSPDDRELIRRTFDRIEDLDVVCLECTTGREALKLLAENHIDCVLLDYALPGWNGIEILKRLKAVTDDTPVIMMTGQGSEEIAVQAMKQGAQDYITKGQIGPASLRRAVTTALSQSGLQRKIREQRQKILDQQADLHHTTQLNAAILESAPCMIVATDISGVISAFNRAAERISGYRASEVTGHYTPAILCDPEQLQKRVDDLTVALGRAPESEFAAMFMRTSDETDERREWVFRHRDGSEYPVRVSISELSDGIGPMVGYLAVVNDISQLKKSEMARRQNERLLRLSMDHAPSGIALVDLEMRWMQVNPAMCKLLGYSAAELRHALLSERIHPDEVVQTEADFSALLDGSIDTVSKERRLLNKEGGQIWVHFSFSLIRDDNDLPMHFMLQVMDITERKEMDRMKSEFISIVSHELRTPLTSINGSLGLLLNTQSEAMPVFARELVSVANRNCERLMSLVDDIIDIDRISTGQLHLDMTAHPLTTLIQQVVEANSAYARQLAVKLVAETDTPDVELLVDASRVLQVLTNFASNAAKFSSPGDEVEIMSQVRDNTVRIVVCDHGRGVPADYEKRMFTRFAQADSSATRKRNGSGLGLYIAKQMTEQMGGRIGYQPTPGGGSTFWVEFPRAVPADHPSAQLKDSRRAISS